MSTKSVCLAIACVVVAGSMCAQQHPAFRLGVYTGWRAAVQTSEVDAAITRRVAFAGRPEVMARARWNVDRNNAIGVLAEVSWATQSTAVGQGTTNVVTRLDHIVGVVGVTLGPAWLGVGYGHPLSESIQAADMDGTQRQVNHHHDGMRLAPVVDVRVGVAVPVVVTDVGDVDVGLALGTALTSAYVSTHPVLLRAAWLRLEIGWTIELW